MFLLGIILPFPIDIDKSKNVIILKIKTYNQIYTFFVQTPRIYLKIKKLFFKRIKFKGPEILQFSTNSMEKVFFMNVIRIQLAKMIFQI